MAALVGCQLVGCSDDDTTPSGSQDSATPDSANPSEASVADTSTQDAGHQDVMTTADAGGDVAVEATVEAAADGGGDAGDAGDAATDAHLDGGDAGDATTDAKVDAGDTGADVMSDVMAADVVDAQGDHVVAEAGMMDAGDAMTMDVTVGEGGSGGDATVLDGAGGDTGSGGDVVVGDVMAADVAADVDAGPTVQALCNAFMVANASLLPFSDVCSPTEVAIYAHDVVKNPTTAPCMACALNKGCIDDTFAPTDNIYECQDGTFTSTGTTADECVAEVTCGLGLPSTCNGASLPSDCTTTTTTIETTLGGIAVPNLYCGNITAPVCNGNLPAQEQGTCVTAWTNGIAAADRGAQGTTVLGDGAMKASAAGFANGLLTCFKNNCLNECVIQ